MNLNNKYLQLPNAIKDTFYEDATKVFVGGELKIAEFEKEFKKTMRTEVLNAEKALHVALQVPPRALSSIESILS